MFPLVINPTPLLFTLADRRMVYHNATIIFPTCIVILCNYAHYRLRAESAWIWMRCTGPPPTFTFSSPPYHEHLTLLSFYMLYLYKLCPPCSSPHLNPQPPKTLSLCKMWYLVSRWVDQALTSIRYSFTLLLKRIYMVGCADPSRNFNSAFWQSRS